VKENGAKSWSFGASELGPFVGQVVDVGAISTNQIKREVAKSKMSHAPYRMNRVMEMVVSRLRDCGTGQFENDEGEYHGATIHHKVLTVTNNWVIIYN